MAKNPPQPFDDGKTEAEATRRPRALFEALELLEDLALLVAGDTEPGVPNLDPHRACDAAAADQHAPLRRVLDGVGDEIL